MPNKSPSCRSGEVCQCPPIHSQRLMITSSETTQLVTAAAAPHSSLNGDLDTTSRMPTPTRSDILHTLVAP